MSLLSASDLRVRLGQRDVVNGISFSVEPGEFIGLVGPNGAGKSTLLRALAGILPYTGSIKLNSDESNMLTAARRALALTFLPQERDIAWNISVEALISLGRSPYLPALSSLRASDIEAVDAAMRRMDVEMFRNRPITELSGGEKARVLVARALAQETPVLLADEPTAGLDPAHNLSLMKIFSILAAEGKSVIASTHDLGLAAANCTRLILLDAGKIVVDGRPADVLTATQMRSVYGVDTYIGSADGQMIIQPTGLAEPQR